MGNQKGDLTKQPEYCKNQFNCPNLKETNPTDMEGGQYSCDVCGKRFYLDYDEMK